MHDQQQSHQTRLPRHLLARSVGALVGFLLAVVASIALALRLWHLPAGGPSVNVNWEARSAEPVLETAPQLDRAQFEQSQQRKLGALGWVDKAKGVAHIPMGDALHLIAEGRMTLPGGPGQIGKDTEPTVGNKP